MSKFINRNLLVPVKRAIGDYGLLSQGDVVAVGVSGGKDSLATLLALYELQRILPISYQLMAISVDLGWEEGSDWSAMIDFCAERNIPYVIEKTLIASIVFDYRQESNPCSLCSKMRKGALIKKAKELNCNVIALGHHLNDAIETVLMNMMFTGRFECFDPGMYLDRMDVNLIRPMIYVPESVTKRVARSLDFAEIKRSCPADGVTKRQHIKELIQTQEAYDDQIPLRLFAAVKKYWLQKGLYKPEKN